MASGGEAFGIRFWGVRGSLPVPGPSTVRYGGNTPCLEIRAGGTTLIIDCGTGAYLLGKDLLDRGATRAHLLMTHMHLDHVIGFPMFQPAYQKGFDLTCWSLNSGEGTAAEPVLRSLTEEPTWPLGPLAANRSAFHGFDPAAEFMIDGAVRVKTQRLNHPGGSTGYRVEFGGKAVAIIFDHEHGDTAIDREVLRFVEGCDLMVYDAAFTPEEYERHRGWGHSTWREGLDLARAAHIALPIMFHHSPDRTDDELDMIENKSRAEHPSALCAREGLIIMQDPTSGDFIERVGGG